MSLNIYNLPHSNLIPAGSTFLKNCSIFPALNLKLRPLLLLQAGVNYLLKTNSATPKSSPKGRKKVAKSYLTKDPKEAWQAYLTRTYWKPQQPLVATQREIDL